MLPILPNMQWKINIGEKIPTVRSTQRMGESGNIASPAALLNFFMDLYWIHLN